MAVSSNCPSNKGDGSQVGVDAGGSGVDEDIGVLVHVEVGVLVGVLVGV